MTTFSASVATTGFALLLAAAIPAQTPSLESAQAQSQNPIQQTVSVSKIRIVRLSVVRGIAQLDRSNGHGFEPAIPNLPIVEGNRLRTDKGIAEVEFEDNSTMRLGPNSEVQFTELGRAGTGATISRVLVLNGTAYVSLLKLSNKNAVPNQFDLAFGDRSIPLPPGAHVRLEMDAKAASPEAQLSVLDGNLHIDSPNGPLDISHKKTATFALANENEPVIAKTASESPLDAWDKQSMQYHQHIASFADYGSAPYAYGLSDMMYYGAFADTGGCGMMWRPYFTGVNWSPYSSGAWAYYANAGYSWVSPYPWGWTPYHYGSWGFCPGAGWGWMPGGAWNGIDNIASLNSLSTSTTSRRIKTKGGPTLPTAPPHPPKAGEPSLLGHNLSALVHSGTVSGREGDGSGAFVFVKNSAGLGIPRNELGNLRGFSHRAEQRGMAATPIYTNVGRMEPVAHGAAISRSSGNSYTVVAVHRGFAPSVASSPSASFSYSGARGTAGATTMNSMSMRTSSAPSVSSAGGGSSHH